MKTTKKRTTMRRRNKTRTRTRINRRTSGEFLCATRRILLPIWSACLRPSDSARSTSFISHIPQTLRERAKIDLPGGLTELAVRRRLMALAAGNANAGDWSFFFLGGGIYHHFIPSAVDAIISRSEFATSYSPYQPEVSQGTLQALFEYQTLICQLTGMGVSNAAVYDGASAVAEAVLMSRRIQPLRRRRVLVSQRAPSPIPRSGGFLFEKSSDIQLQRFPLMAAAELISQQLKAS